MDKEQVQIKEFMDKAGQSYPTTPTIPDEKTIQLRLNLIIEEVKELAAACGYELATNLIVAEMIEDQKVDLVEVADALTDINYVTKGAGIAFGIDLEPIFGLVQTTNMAKFGPGGYRREDGKWMKPPDWKKPNIAAELARQMQPPDVNAAIDLMVEEREGTFVTAPQKAVAVVVEDRPLGKLTRSVEDFATALNHHSARVAGQRAVPSMRKGNEFLDSVADTMKLYRGEE